MQPAPALRYLGELPVVLVADIMNCPAGIAGAIVPWLGVALWLGVWHPTVRRMAV